METLQNDELAKTLQLAGIEASERVALRILSHGYSQDSIKATHKETNNRIQECLNNNALGDCIHITGEMRALTDPFHRNLCDEISRKNKSVFKVVYNLPEEHRSNATSILEWNLESWAQDKPARVWQEELRTIYSIANRSVSLYALDTSNVIQYSVFGNKYILLQERHKDRAEKKNVWLLESDAINSHLTDNAKNLIIKSQEIDGGNYRRFTKNLCGVASRKTLLSLEGGRSLPKEHLLYELMANDLTDAPQEVISTLDAMGFIERIDNSDLIKISSSGREFLK